MANPYFTPPPSYGTPPIMGAPGEGDGSIMASTLANATKKKQSTLGQVGSFILEALTGIPSAAHRQQRDVRELAQYGQRSMLQQQIEEASRTRERTASNEDWRMRQDYEVAHRPPPQDPAAVLIAKAAGLTPGTPQWQAALTSAIPGYGYTQPAIDAKTAAQVSVAKLRAGQSAALKAQPTYAQTHPKASGGRSGGGKPAKLPTGFILD